MPCSCGPRALGRNFGRGQLKLLLQAPTCCTLVTSKVRRGGAKVSPGLQEAEYLWTTVCYVLWPEGARKLLATLPVDEPIDNFMAWQVASRRVCALAVTPPLVDQELEWDQGS